MKFFTLSPITRRALSAALVLFLVGQSCSLLAATPEVDPGNAEPTATTAAEIQPVENTQVVSQPATEVPPEATPTITIPTEVAVIGSEALVRRLSAGVFAGSNDPLSPVNSADAIDLPAGGLLTTDFSGEAEIVIDGCLKLFVFQDGGLNRGTCRKDDAGSGLGVCASAGMTGVLNSCVAQVDIQSPSSVIEPIGTWFAVIYLPADQLSIVQVYEGAVNVQAVTDTRTGQTTGGQRIGEGSMWFSTAGSESQDIAGIPGRTEQPMEIWEAVRPELRERYPNLDLWMNSAAEKAREEGLTFPGFLERPSGVITVHFEGDAFRNPEIQSAMLLGAEWVPTSLNIWPDSDIRPQLEFPDRSVPDLSGWAYDASTAQSQLSQAGFDYQTSVVIMLENDQPNLLSYASIIDDYLRKLGLNTNFTQVTPDSRQELINIAQSDPNFPVIWFEGAGEALEGDLR